MKQGLFITFEGGEGSGKSTQIKLLASYLADKGYDVVLSREPGGSQGAEEIRNLLLKGESGRWDKKTEILLFTAARRDHLVKKIWPALEKGQIVLCDRFMDSTRAYQGYGYGFDTKTVTALEDMYSFIAGDFKPDMTFVLDIDPKTGLMRSKSRQGNDEQRFENMHLDFHTNLREAFLKFAQTEPERFCVIDASQTIEKIHQDILLKINEKLG